MKRVALGIAWFIALWLGTIIAGSSVAGAIAGSQVNAKSMAEGYAKGQVAGQQAGAEFGRRFGGIILLGSLVIAIGGTVAGVLPGTRPKQRSENT